MQLNLTIKCSSKGKSAVNLLQKLVPSVKIDYAGSLNCRCGVFHRPVKNFIE